MLIRTTVLSIGATVMLAGTAHAQAVGIGTGPQASLTNRLGSGIAKVIADVAGLKTRAVPHTSGAAATPLVEKGSLAFGINSTGDINDAVAGRGHYEGHPVSKKYVIAARMVPLPVGTLVRKDSPYKKLTDLRGKKFTTGYTAHKTVRNVLKAILANSGMKVSEFISVPVPNTKGGAKLFVKGSVEGTVSSLGGSRLRNVAAKVGGIRILKMNTDPAAIKAMQTVYPGSYLVEKKGLGAEGKTMVMAFDMVLMTSTNTPADIVYKSVKALHGGKKGLVKITPVFKGFKPANMVVKLEGVKIHPGAMRFYKEQGMM